MHIAAPKGEEYKIDEIRPLIISNPGDDELILNVNGTDHICKIGINVTNSLQKKLSEYFGESCVSAE